MGILGPYDTNMRAYLFETFVRNFYHFDSLAHGMHALIKRFLEIDCPVKPYV